MQKKVLFTFLIIAIFLTSGYLSGCQSQPSPTSLVESTTAPVVSTTQNELSTAIPTETQILAPTPDEESMRTAIVTALLAISTTQNRMDIRTEIQGGKVNNSFIEFIPPDRKHIVSVEDEVEYIIIAEKVYMKTKSSDGWEEAQIPASVFMGQGVATEQSIGEMLSKVEYVRNDQLDGKPMLVVNYIEITKTSDGELESKVELWIGENDGLPYKMIKDGKIYSVINDPQTGESKQEYVNAMTTTNINFDPNFQIEAPIQD